MGFKASFLANQYVSDEDINAVGYNLSNTVYTSFANDTVYGVNELNSITAHMMNKGVKRNYKNECAVSLNEGIVHIDSGLVFFDNGATMNIDDEGIDLTVEDTEQQYIYLFFDEALNVAGARCAALPEANVSYVILGTVANGVVTQDRTFAYLNTDVKGTNEVTRFVVEGVEKITNEKHYIEFATPVNVSGYKRAYYRPDYENGNFTYSNDFITGVVDIQNKISELHIRANDKSGTAFSDSDFDVYVDISNATEKSNVQIIDGILYVRDYATLQSPIVFELFGGVE